MPSNFAPLKALQTWYDDTPGFIAPKLFLLDATVTSISDTYDTVSDLPGQLTTGGGYDATTGIAAGNWPLFSDPGQGVLELSTPAATWVSTATYTLSFRWVAISIYGGYLLSVADLGSTQILNGSHLTLYAAESTYIPNSYPVFRWRRN